MDPESRWSDRSQPGRVAGFEYERRCDVFGDICGRQELIDGDAKCAQPIGGRSRRFERQCPGLDAFCPDGGELDVTRRSEAGCSKRAIREGQHGLVDIDPAVAGSRRHSPDVLVPLFDTSDQAGPDRHVASDSAPLLDLERAAVSPFHTQVGATGHEIGIDPFLHQDTRRGGLEPLDRRGGNLPGREPPQLKSLEQSGLPISVAIGHRPGLLSRKLLCHEGATVKILRFGRIRHSES